MKTILLMLLVAAYICCTKQANGTETEGDGFDLVSMDKGSLSLTGYPEDDPKVNGVKRSEDIGKKIRDHFIGVRDKIRKDLGLPPLPSASTKMRVSLGVYIVAVGSMLFVKTII